jgi:hypothetical protein
MPAKRLVLPVLFFFYACAQALAFPPLSEEVFRQKTQDYSHTILGYEDFSDMAYTLYRECWNFIDRRILKDWADEFVQRSIMVIIDTKVYSNSSELQELLDDILVAMHDERLWLIGVPPPGYPPCLDDREKPDVEPIGDAKLPDWGLNASEAEAIGDMAFDSHQSAKTRIATIIKKLPSPAPGLGKGPYKRRKLKYNLDKITQFDPAKHLKSKREPDQI